MRTQSNISETVNGWRPMHLPTLHSHACQWNPNAHMILSSWAENIGKKKNMQPHDLFNWSTYVGNECKQKGWASLQNFGANKIMQSSLR